MASKGRCGNKRISKFKGGIRTHLILGLTVFVLVILAIVWVFQVLLLNFFYERTKLSQLEEVESYIEKNINNEDIDALCGELASKYDVCISVYKAEDGVIRSRFIDKEVSPTCVIHYAGRKLLDDYYAEALKAGGEYTQRYTLTPGNPNGVSEEVGDKSETPGKNRSEKYDAHSLVVAVAVKSLFDSSGNEYAVFINLEFTPISTVQQTRNVQFWYITIVVVFLTILFAWFFSGKISHPLEKMTAEAEKMADRTYHASFDEDGYSETQRLASALNYAASEIAKTDRLQRELIANVSHDLRTPLTLIAGYAEMMRDIPGENSSENCQYIIDETRRLTTLVNDLLDFSKYNSECEEPKLEEINLTESVQIAIARYGELIRHEGYSIEFVASDSISVMADEGMILQVLYNLLNNAINYTGADKKVYIKQKVVPGNKVRITVTDTGTGISGDDIERIWDRYYSESKSHKRAVVGSGIGLSIVSRLLQLHSASYGVESSEGRGTSFWFELAINNK